MTREHAESSGLRGQRTEDKLPAEEASPAVHREDKKRCAVGATQNVNGKRTRTRHMPAPSQQTGGHTMQATQMREITWTQNGEERKEVVTVAQARALASYLEGTLRIVAEVRPA
jgi:hypothetical protein